MAAPRAASPTSLATELDRRLVALNRLLRSGTTEAGLSITSLSTLRRLADSGRCRITDLAAGEAVAQPSMTALIGRLEARGLVVREPDTADRRAVLIAITPAGREALEAQRAQRADLLRARLEAMDSGERAALAGALAALDHLLDPGAE